MNINKVLQIAGIEKELLNEGFYKELPKRYINNFIKLLIVGQKQKNSMGYKTPGIKDILEKNVFKVIKELYSSLVSEERINQFLKNNSGSDLKYEMSRFILDRGYKNWRQNNVSVIFDIDLENPLESNDISQEHMKFTAVKKLLDMKIIPITIHVISLKKNYNIVIGASYINNTNIIDEFKIYLNLYNLNEILNKDKNDIDSKISKFFNLIKSELFLKMKSVLSHELIHHIQATSDKPNNKRDSKKYYDDENSLYNHEPFPIEKDYESRKEKYDNFYKNLKIENLVSLGSNIETKAYLNEILQGYRHINKLLKMNKISQEEYNNKFVDLIEYTYLRFKIPVENFAEKHFSKKLQMYGQKYNRNSTPLIAMVALWARYISIIQNDYGQSGFIKTLVSLLEKFDSKTKQVLEAAIKKASTEKHSLK